MRTRVRTMVKLSEFLPAALLLAALCLPGARAAEEKKSEAKAAPAKPMVLDLDKSEGAVTFDAVGKPSALKIHAKGDAPKGQLTAADGKVTGTATFKLDSLDTSIGLRNEHMKKKYLETGKFPEAKLSITELAVPANYSAPDFSAENLPFKGSLSLHGIDKPIEGTAKLARSGDSLSVKASFPVRIEEFGIKVPTFAGITVANDVSCGVEVKAPFKSQ